MENWGGELLELYRRKTKLRGLLTPIQGFCIADVMGFISELFGVKSTRMLSEKIASPHEFSGIERAVLVVVDALGYKCLIDGAKRCGLEVFLKSLNAVVRPLLSIAPSTTAAALASIVSGLYPAEHGIAGYRMWIKELGTVVKTLRYSPAAVGGRDLLEDSRAKIDEIFDFKTTFESLRDAGVPSVAFVHHSLSDTAFTRLLYAGAEVREYIQVTDQIVAVEKWVKSGGEGLAATYIGILDEVGHVYGTSSEEFQYTVELVLHMLARLLRVAHEVGRTLVVVIADHGMLDVQGVVRLDEVGIIRYLRVPPAGESRFMYLHLDANYGLGDLAGLFGDSAEHFVFISTDELLKGGVFGPADKAKLVFLEAIGDAVATPLDGWCMFYPYRSDKEWKLKGHHGGLTEREMIVPFIAVA